MATAKKPIKVNSNPNKTPAKGQRNPTAKAIDAEEAMEPVRAKYGYPPKKTVKINTNPVPVTNRQPRVGGAVGLGGGRIGGDFLDQTK